MARLGWTFSPEKRSRLRDADTKWKSKAWLRSACTLLAFLAMCLFAAAVAQTIAWEREWTDGNGGDWTDGMCLAPVMLSLLLSPALLYLSLSRPLNAKKPLHPAIPLTVDLIIWCLCLPCIVFSIGTGWFWYWQPAISLNGRIPCNAFNMWSKACQPDIYRIGAIEIVANVFLILLLIFHFTLFVLSCIAVHRLRRRKRLSQIHPNLDTPVTDPTAAQRNIELQFNRSPDEHAKNSPTGVPPAYVSGVPPGGHTTAGLHDGQGKMESGHSFDSRSFDPDHGTMRFDKDLEAGNNNPFGDENAVKGNETDARSIKDKIEGAVKYL